MAMLREGERAKETRRQMSGRTVLVFSGDPSKESWREEERKMADCSLSLNDLFHKGLRNRRSGLVSLFLSSTYCRPHIWGDLCGGKGAYCPLWSRTPIVAKGVLPPTGSSLQPVRHNNHSSLRVPCSRIMREEVKKDDGTGSRSGFLCSIHVILQRPQAF